MSTLGRSDKGISLSSLGQRCSMHKVNVHETRGADVILDFLLNTSVGDELLTPFVQQDCEVRGRSDLVNSNLPGETPVCFPAWFGRASRRSRRGLRAPAQLEEVCSRFELVCLTICCEEIQSLHGRILAKLVDHVQPIRSRLGQLVILS